MEADSRPLDADVNRPPFAKPTWPLKPVYFISGLGADERVFDRLNIDGYCPIHVRWLKPHPGERLADYAKRLKAQITDPEPVLVGLSFGGLVAIELAKQVSSRQVILISSAKSSREIPAYFKLFRFFPIHRILPFKSLLWTVQWLVDWLFSLQELNEKRLLQTILTDTDPVFLKWALHRVVVWRNQQVPEGVLHLHGRRDRVFPARWVQADVEIDGGHLMVMNRAPVVSRLIKESLAQSVSQPAPSRDQLHP
ncbi:alpha/beta hydrolase [filamentous cyanobacterium CCP5]|nr:alpha/beta hydrolase [filamentous cyanobacterium CCP5]